MIRLIPILFLLGCATVPVKPDDPVRFVFKVEVYRNGVLEGNGTGFIARIENDTAYVITNKHVCHEGAEYVLVDYDFGHHSAQLYLTHDTADLCILKAYGNFKTRAIFAEPKSGEHITSIGAPHGAFPIINDGYVRFSAIFDSTIHNIHYHFAGRYVSLNSEEGSSGSPVFNDEHQVVGVMFGTVDGNLSCMIPAQTIQNFVTLN